LNLWWLSHRWQHPREYDGPAAIEEDHAPIKTGVFQNESGPMEASLIHEDEVDEPRLAEMLEESDGIVDVEGPGLAELAGILDEPVDEVVFDGRAAVSARSLDSSMSIALAAAAIMAVDLVDDWRFALNQISY
jgi:hypothetical protein